MQFFRVLLKTKNRPDKKIKSISIAATTYLKIKGIVDTLTNKTLTFSD